MSIVGAFVALCLLQEADVAELSVGSGLEAAIEATDPVIRTPRLVRDYDDAPVRGKTYRLDVPAGNAVTIEVRSYFFDAYLVVRDENGTVVAEDDDGWVATQSRVVLEAVGGETRRRVDVCALHGETGPFQVHVSSGPPPAGSTSDRAALELQEAQKAAEVVEAAFGPRHVATIRRIGALGRLLWSRGEYPAARVQFERAMPLCEEVLGVDHPETITCVGNLAIQLMELGDYRRAQPLFERQFTSLESRLGIDHQTTIWVLRNLASVLAEQGEYARARALHERALESSERVSGHDSPDSAQSLNNLGNLSLRQGDFVTARSLYERAVRIFESRLGPGHPITTSCMNNLALALDELGEDREARRVCERALAIRRKRLGEDHLDTAASEMTLAGLLRDGGNAEEALPLLEKALATIEKRRGPTHPNTGRCLQAFGAAVADLGQLPRALSLYRRALAIFEESLGPDQPDVAIVLGSIAWILSNTGREAEAIPLFERQLAIWERVVGADHAFVGWTLNGLALTRMSIGEDEQADALFERALEIGRSAPGNSRSSCVHALSNRALCKCNLALAQEAVPLARESWELLRREADERLLVATDWERFAWLRDNTWPLEVLVSVLGTQAAGDDAATTYDAVRHWKGIASRAAIETRSRAIASMPSEARGAIEELHGVQSVLSQEALRYDVRSRDAHEKKLASLREREGELQRVLAEVGGAHPSAGSVPFAAFARSLPDASVLIDFYVHRTFVFGSKTGPPAAASGHWGESRLHAWIVRSGSEKPIAVDLGPAAEAERVTRAFLAAFTPLRGAGPIAREDDGNSILDEANTKFREMLWKPIAEHVTGASRLFVSPDRFLGAVPFGALRLEDGRFLLERMAITYVADANVLARRAAEPPPSERTDGDVLVVGDVDFDPRETPAASSEPAAAQGSAEAPLRSFHDRWDPLPGSRREMASIQGVRQAALDRSGGIVALSRSDATESAIKSSLPGKRFVHLATHGFFEPKGLPSWWEEVERPGRIEMRMPSELRRVTGLMPGLLSGVVCAGANRAAASASTSASDDGYLTAEEITWLDLSGCALVVLSACDTGIGTERGGEGMASVERAFELAGARAVVASLWKVDDEAAAELMKRFYENLWIGKQPAADALRQAQLDLLRKGRVAQGDGRPSDWGAFVLSGDWR